MEREYRIWGQEQYTPISLEKRQLVVRGSGWLPARRAPGDRSTENTLEHGDELGGPQGPAGRLRL